MSDGTKAGTQAPALREQDVLLTGGAGVGATSSRAGYLPVPLAKVPIKALKGIPVYLRSGPAEDAITGGTAGKSKEQFRLYCSEDLNFTENHRLRLVNHGVKFVYVPMTSQSRFRNQTEEELANVATDPALGVSERSALIYETSVELTNELLTDPMLAVKSPRLEAVSRAVTMLTMNEPGAFTHLLAASHHDFYTATHMVNVGTWMVPLAYEMGIRDADELNRICRAGLLHDIGKINVPESILNKKGKLEKEEWEMIKRHPVAGCEYLARFEGVEEIIFRVTREHHERMDGTGYPDGIKGDKIHPISRICAVVDSFDAMTAFRPFKDRTLSVDEALEILKKEAPAKYDQDVVNAWLRLVKTAANSGAVSTMVAPAAAGAASGAKADGKNRRQHERHSFHCPGRVHRLETKENEAAEQPAIPVMAHSISRGGLGFLSQTPLPPGEFVHVYVDAKGFENRTLEGQIVRCRDYRDSWHELGMQFEKFKADTLPIPAATATPPPAAAAA